jgi:hypothetical protein
LDIIRHAADDPQREDTALKYPAEGLFFMRKGKTAMTATAVFGSLSG